MLLAVDTATRNGSVALLDGDRVIDHRPLDPAAKHGSALGPAIEALLGFDLDRVEAYALTIGPGSFTGLRIGLAFVKGLAMVHEAPAIPISTLLVMARAILDQHPEATFALPMLDARREEVFAALYDRALDPAALPDGVYGLHAIAPRISQIEGAVAAGDGLLLPHASRPWIEAERGLWSPDARVLGRLALERLRRGEGVEVASLQPVYLQLAPAEVAANDSSAKDK
jgi:tRNA threonylcarbamoyladenosine biosynthesis protein TsaB